MIISKTKRTQALPLISTLDLPTVNSLTTAKVVEVVSESIAHDRYARRCVETDFGVMDLCTQRLNQKENQLQQLKLKLYKKQPHLFPLIYEHHTIQQPDGEYVLVILREKVGRVREPQIDRCLVDLIETMSCLQECNLSVVTPLDSLHESNQNNKYYVNYFRIIESTLNQHDSVKQFLVWLAKLQNQVLNRSVYLLEDQVYKWNITHDDLIGLSEREHLTWDFIAILMNVPYVRNKEFECRYTHQKHTKRLKIEELGGQVELIGRIVNFRSGKCIDQYKLLTPQSLKQQFFEPQKTYRVQKRNCVTITKEDNSINKNESFAIIQQCIQKVECVQFFIVYMKYFELTIEKIVYKRSLNELQLTLAKGKYVVIKFPRDYVVKEEQLSIILNKSHLADCTLSLMGSQISDKMMILLSNLEKMACIRKLDLSYCVNLTEFGLVNLFDNALCSGLVELNLSGCKINQTIVQSFKNMPDLKSLILNNCKQLGSDTNPQLISIKTYKLEVLELINTPVLVDVQSQLRVLKLTIDYPYENLRLLSRMPLFDLKLRLVENKKQQVLSFVNSIYSSIGNNYAREFCDGLPGKYLKYVDLSDSFVKYKLIRPILQIKNLNEVKLNGCNRLGDEYDALGGDVQVLEIKESTIPWKNLKLMVDRLSFIKLLDMRGCSLDKRDVVEFLDSINKQMNELCVDQQQYSSQLLATVNRQKGSTINKLTVRVHPSMNQKFFSMIYNVNKSNKIVNFDCDENEQLKIAKKIATFLGVKEKATFRIRSQQLSKVLEKNIGHSQRKEFRFLWSTSCTPMTFKICSYASRKQPLLHINLKGNRLISVDCIRMIHLYASEYVTSIDFRNCLFDFNQVFGMLHNWPNLVSVNEGDFNMVWDKKSFSTFGQKMLKFFMHLQKVVSFVVEVRKVKEVQLLFSILYYIVNHHKPTLNVFKISLKKINMELSNEECTEFWEALLTTITLKTLSIETEDCTNFDKNHYKFMVNINRLNLSSLTMRLPAKMPVYPRIATLGSLRLFVSGYGSVISGDTFVTENYLAEVIKQSSNMEYLEIECNGCSNLTQLNSFNSQLKHLRRLKSLILSLQYCPLKPITLSNILDSLTDLRYLNRISIDISFSCEIVEDVSTKLIALAQSLNQPYIQVIGLNVFKRGSLEFEAQMQEHNIRTIY